MCVCVWTQPTHTVVKLTCVCYVQQSESDIHQDVLAAMASVAKLQEHIETIKTHTLPVRCTSDHSVALYAFT